MSKKSGGPRVRRGLSRGLESLVAERVATGSPAGTPVLRQVSERTLAITELAPNPYQPRTEFAPDDLASLARSLKQSGMLQPILVRPDPVSPDRFQILAGERRWRAAQEAGLHRVPVRVRSASDQEAAGLALIENMERADLNALEEASGLRRLVDEFGFTQSETAQVVSRSRSYVANSLRLLSLPESVQQMIRSGDLSAGTARPLVGSPEALKLARTIVRRGLNARAAERLVKHRKRTRNLPERDPNLDALERDLQDSLGMAVAVRGHGRRGELRIRYERLEQLDELLRRLGVG